MKSDLICQKRAKAAIIEAMAGAMRDEAPVKLFNECSTYLVPWLLAYVQMVRGEKVGFNVL